MGPCTGLLPFHFGCFGACLEVVAVISSFQNIATISEAIEPNCCTTLTVGDSDRESIWLDSWHEQAISRPLPHDELIQLHRLTEEARVAVDLAGQGNDLACAA